ncbi:MAG: BREX-2 system adenine-specific DNA-methyltransferase PglX [Phycisphaerae bacterium]|nr:BREX-2 system adenine-specific DNA-methyltransferase PglX [Phycisphaerae bacterium]
MIDRKQLLADLKPLLKEFEADLRARCDEVPQIDADLQKEYAQAKDAGRTGDAYEAWRADLITQVAAAWVLSCVFVRFLEDNELISPPRISGPLHGAGDGRGMARARDERDLYFKDHAKNTDRDYLLAVFDDMAKLPGAKDIFGPHNLVNAYRDWLSGDAAQKLIEFFQRIDKDESGELVHDFTDPTWDTRFLGDLYQDLSEAARKKYALLQTPVFVEEFILDRTLEPAIDAFGLKGLRMIDPACGSGHFLLGAFARVLKRWRTLEPATPDRELINNAAASIHGVDLNPFAVAIARFRLLAAAMRECHLRRLAHAPTFRFRLACGDSLLHGARESDLGLVADPLGQHVYGAEDLPTLRQILRPNHYHVVVGNPPYIAVKDSALRAHYRDRFTTCYGRYTLSVPFFERFFDLAIQPSDSRDVSQSGFIGKITANAFMKREFGKRLIEKYLAGLDLTHVIDTSGAYIPGHGTPTVIIFARNRLPVGDQVRAVMGIRGEPRAPEDPARGLVWTAILHQIDVPGSESTYISVADSDRKHFANHPWSIGGGGAADLKASLDEGCELRVVDVAESTGIMSVTGEDELYIFPDVLAIRRLRIEASRSLVMGDQIRDWQCDQPRPALWPYDTDLKPRPLESMPNMAQLLWQHRSVLSRRKKFGTPMLERGMTWYEWQELYTDKLKTALALVYGEVATHNNFVFDRGGRIFNRTAPLIKLRSDATDSDHFPLLGILNSSLTCFWLKQGAHNKGDSTDDQGARTTGDVAFNTYAFNARLLERLPLPSERPQAIPRQLDKLSRRYRELTPDANGLLTNNTEREAAAAEAERTLGRLIALQEELDWECYQLYGIIDNAPLSEDPPPIHGGERAFEFVLAQRIKTGEEESTWFQRHGFVPRTEMPPEWPKQYRTVVQKRIDFIRNDPRIGLIERPENKRRWHVESRPPQEQRACRAWLLCRLEYLFDLDGRMNEEGLLTAHASLREPRVTNTAQVADLARVDTDFMQVAALYAGRMDFDVARLVDELIAEESVPALPVLRYRPSGLDKRAVWERTWDLQREEDRLTAAREAAHDALQAEEDRIRERFPEETRELKASRALLLDLCKKLYRDFAPKAEVTWEYEPEITAGVLLSHGVPSEGLILARQMEDLKNTVHKQSMNLDSLVREPCKDDRDYQAALEHLDSIPQPPEIAVPPKYKSSDFLDGNYWRLRGKLDVPKERWVSFPYCEGEDGTLVIAWAGYDHLQLARAIAERYELAKEQEGRKLVPLLAAIGQLIPWLKQWHNELDPAYGTRMGDYFENYLAEEAKAIGKTVDEVMAWKPPADAIQKKRRRRTKVT